jgi:hypothetical protein
MNNNDGRKSLQDGTKMENLKFHPLARFMLEQLPVRDQTDVEKRLSALAGKAPEDWPSRLVRKYPNDPSMYLVRVNASLRAVLRAVKGNAPEVLDLFRKEAADYFAKSVPNHQD